MYAEREPIRRGQADAGSQGYRLTRISGSHHVFTKAGVRPVPIPVHNGKVKPGYVRMIGKLEA
jgi:predicted RNA binding protein YcfA (HicA-like mRNA interferase family)